MSRFAPVLGRIAVFGALIWTTACGEPPQVAGPIPPMTIYIGDNVAIDLSEHFTDPDGDALSYSASSSDPATVAVSVAGSMLEMVPKAKGAVRVTVQAMDGNGTSPEITVSVTVGNRAPVVVDSTAVMDTYVTQTVEFVIPDYLIDPDGDEVTYEARSSNDAVVIVSLDADTLEAVAAGRGEARITVTATDTEGLSTTMSIPATIGPIPERVVLQYLYDATAGTGWRNSDNWGTGADLGTWYGVEVDEQGQVRSLSLGANNLRGTIAPQLGELDALEYLNLESNELDGGLPASLARLPLSEFHLSNNAGLEGEIGVAFRTHMTGLDALFAAGTNLCAPNDDRFRTWLGRIDERRVKMCDPVSPTAYLIQAAQSSPDSVDRIPLVGGKQALLRVFVTSSHSTHDTEIPPVKATFYDDDDVIHTVTVPGKDEPVSVIRMEESLRGSANVMIPGDVIRPSLDLVVEIDPEGTLDEELDVAARVPEDGRLEYRVYNLSTFDLTVIPFLWKSDPDSAVIDYARKMEEDEEEYSLLHPTYDLLPIGDIEVTAYDPVESSSNDLRDILPATEVIRRNDGGDGYFQGHLTGRLANNIRGIAYWPGKSSASIPDGLVMSHEFGHNLYLRHAPCGGGRDPDTDFPYDRSKIGNWGYEYREHELVDPNRHYDMMSYCDPQWISDYNFDKVIRYRRARSYEERGAPSEATQTLLVWGGLDEDGKPYLRPSFVMKARPGLPASAGAHTLTARDSDGTAVLSLSFDMTEIADAPGRSSHFVFTVPVQEGWAGALASITLSGPGGTATLDRHADEAMTIAIDRTTGRIRAFWDGWHEPRAGRPELVLMRSRGIPGAEEWER